MSVAVLPVDGGSAVFMTGHAAAKMAHRADRGPCGPYAGCAPRNPATGGSHDAGCPDQSRVDHRARGSVPGTTSTTYTRTAWRAARIFGRISSGV